MENRRLDNCQSVITGKDIYLLRTGLLHLLRFHMIWNLLVKNGQVGHVLFLFKLGRITLKHFGLRKRHRLMDQKNKTNCCFNVQSDLGNGYVLNEAPPKATQIDSHFRYHSRKCVSESRIKKQTKKSWKKMIHSHSPNSLICLCYRWVITDDCVKHDICHIIHPGVKAWYFLPFEMIDPVCGYIL